MAVTSRFLDSCVCNDVLTDAAYFRDPNISSLTRKAVDIITLNSIIAGMSSTDVLTLAELLEIGKCCACDISSLDREAMMTYMLWQLALQVGTVAATAGELIDEACSLNCDPRILDGILIALWCRFLTEVYNDAQPQ